MLYKNTMSSYIFWRLKFSCVDACPMKIFSKVTNKTTHKLKEKEKEE